jgi:hypothetical protein
VSAARTNWHSDGLPTLEIEDPFEVPVEKVGQPIDLSHPTARLNVRLTELLRREGQLDALGVSCSIKDKSDVVCSVCPLSKAGDDSAPLGALCRIGREQEAVTTQLAAQAATDAVSD